MEKVDGIQTARVSLNEGLTILDLKPGNVVTLAKLRHIIKNNGFVSKEAKVLAGGVATDAQTFTVSGTNEELKPSSAPQKMADDWQFMVAPPAR